MREYSKILLTAAVVAAAAGTVALVFNAVRPDGLPLVADVPYEIFVPCPEPLGEVSGVEPSEAVGLSRAGGKVLLIDAGPVEDFRAWHAQGAWNIPFDYIMPVEDRDIRRIASSRSSRVIVYGDGGEPDSGRELARELAGRGINNVAFVRGGGQALKAAGVTK